MFYDDSSVLSCVVGIWFLTCEKLIKIITIICFSGVRMCLLRVKCLINCLYEIMGFISCF